VITKYAFFAGTLKAGVDSQMREYVESTLKPLWLQFQPSLQVQVLYGVEHDPAGPTIPLVLAVTYRDHDAMEQAMQSRARHEARELLPAFYQRYFDEITLWHSVFEVD